MIWCVEDDASIRDIEVYALQSTGFEAKGFEDGTSFWEALRTGRPELVVLDVMLPGIDGMELLRRMRADAALSDIPVVMATAKGAEYDKIRGLDLGADYYLTKPFGVMELVSCVKAVLRRCGTKTAAQLRCGGLVLDEESHTVTADGESVALTYKEFELLRLFLSHPGTAFSRDQIMADVWGTDYCGETRTVDMHIRTLRQKLGAYGEKIETVRGVGYRMEGKAGQKRSFTPSCLWRARCCWRACSSSWAACTNTSGASKKSSCATSWSLPPSPWRKTGRSISLSSPPSATA